MNDGNMKIKIIENVKTQCSDNMNELGKKKTVAKMKIVAILFLMPFIHTFPECMQRVNLLFSHTHTHIHSQVFVLVHIV